MNKKSVFIAELVWLTVICEVSSTPLKYCLIRDRHKHLDCAFIPGGSRKFPEVIGPDPWLPKDVSGSVVETLDISGNIYSTTDCNELIHLVQLIAKSLIFLNKELSVNSFKTCLGKLRQLEELDLSNNVMGSNLTGVSWPKRLFKLTLVKMKLKDIVGLGKLNYLQELDLSYNNLTRFPKLNKTAPILLLHLRGNKMTNITVEDFASYCEMSSFSVPEQINDAKNYHYCAPLQEWTKKYSIDTFETLSCKQPEGNLTKEVTFLEEVMKARNICLNTLPGTDIWDLLFFAVFFTMLFPLLYYANEAYNNYRANDFEMTAESIKRNRRRSSTTASSAVSDYEDSQTEDTTHDSEHEES